VACVCIGMCVYINVLCACMHRYVCVYKRVCVRVCVHVCVCACVCVCVRV